ncbi:MULTISPECIES: DNA cytosine methyltransferase [unclassified Bosea (in: a-proteobacteria)]|uniref:DNA cytosine methyltransferase n=1 Tax=unclassified Bosea (in: a-proteobacteria) TaxID=2653178 RepID=UPI000F7E8DA5|nr:MULTISPECIES: DNA cytosine methyltransferase [unclassified Bosea (in: a-proteobacteria)]RXT22311.1 methyltransferase [Bosea sp. Tri-39]RXT32653.1 methyltransferase [Bosea sp. Tri-54]
MARDYHNEIEPYAAEWIENLIAEGLLPPGDVDRRSIADVHPDDLKGYTRCHFFAGLGGWPLALRIAGWPDDRPLWTGSCPCQPFSVAGSRKGFDDTRHLWPEFGRLIEKRLPPTVFGEQVAGAAEWLASVRSDLDAMGYAVGAIPMEAASAGADHFRDRFWFVADYDLQCPSKERAERGREFSGPGCDQEDRPRPLQDGRVVGGPARLPRSEPRQEGFAGEPDDADREPRSVEHPASLGWGEGWTEHEFRSRGFTAAVASVGGGQYVECPDGRWRRLPPPRVRWLGTRIPARVAKLRALGNAIDPRPAAQVIGAFLDIERAAA